MPPSDDTPARVRWARLRFQIIGTLLAAPPDEGELRVRLTELAARAWAHPTTGEVVRFSFKTIERWFYAARGAADPIAVLARKVPRHAGTHPRISEALAEAIAGLYASHPRWTFQLHHDNLAALAREDPRLAPVPCYATVRRYMRQRGLLRARKKRVREGDEGFTPRETRSFEVAHVHGLWHLDFHEGSRAVLTPSGEWKKPQLLGILDDRSRLCCHLQWYLDETAESLVHGLSQAFHKRGLPRALLFALVARARAGLAQIISNGHIIVVGAGLRATGFDDSLARRLTGTATHRRAARCQSLACRYGVPHSNAGPSVDVVELHELYERVLAVRGIVSKRQPAIVVGHLGYPGTARAQGGASIGQRGID
jgi:hypothetical protein